MTHRRGQLASFLRVLRLLAGNIAVFLLLFLLAEFGYRTLCYFQGQGFFRPDSFTSPWFTGYDPPAPREEKGLSYFVHRAEPVDHRKKEGVYRIIAVGGSTTVDRQAWETGGIDFPGALDSLLNAGLSDRATRRYEVLNAGVDAYSTAQSLINISLRLVEFGPDLIVLMHNINDSSVNGFGSRATSDYGNKYLLPYYLNPQLQATLSLEGLLYQSRLICRLGVPQRMADRNRVIRPENPSVDGLRYFRRNLRSIEATCAAHGVDLLLLTQPHQDQEHRYIRLEVVREYNQAIREEARGRLFLDMEREFGKEPALFFDMVHYTPEGSRRFARLLAPIVFDIASGRGPEPPQDAGSAGGPAFRR